MKRGGMYAYTGYIARARLYELNAKLQWIFSEFLIKCFFICTSLVYLSHPMYFANRLDGIFLCKLSYIPFNIASDNVKR